MDYEKNYPITQQPGDVVLVQWERGYKRVEVSYKGKLIGTVTGNAIKKGVQLQDPILGTIGMRFSETPMALDLVIDGYHSPVNRSHPAKQLKRTAAFFWIIAVFALIASLLEGISVSTDPMIFLTVEGINFLVVAAYVIAAVFTGKSKAWGYYLGFCTFALMYMLFLLSQLVGMSGGGILVFIVRSVVLGVLIYNLRTVIAVQKHARFGKVTNEALLDN